MIADDIGVFLAIARSLGRAGIEVDVATCGESFPGLRSRYVDQTYVLPPYLTTPATWQAELAALVSREDYGLIIPASDSGLDLLAEVAGSIDRDKLAIPNQRALDAFSDKTATRALAQSLDVRMANGIAVAADSDAVEQLSNLSCPCVIKTARSFAVGRKQAKSEVHIARNREGLSAALESLVGQQIIIEDFFIGQGVGVSVLAKDGEVELAWQHRRLAATSATGRSSKRTGQALDPRLLRDVTALAKATELTGIAMFEFRQNPKTGEHILIEVNPRFWGSLPLAVAAGADFPLQLWQQHLGTTSEGSASIDLTQAKSSLAGEYDRISELPGMSGGFALASLILRAILSPAQFDSWAKDDPHPHWQELRSTLGRARDALIRRL